MRLPRVDRVGRFRAVAVCEVWGTRGSRNGRKYEHDVMGVFATADEAVAMVRQPPEWARYATPRYLAGPGGRDSRVRLDSGEWWIAQGRVPRGHRPTTPELGSTR